LLNEEAGTIREFISESGRRGVIDLEDYEESEAISDTISAINVCGRWSPAIWRR
jgi:hypothetical protein